MEKLFQIASGIIDGFERVVSWIFPRVKDRMKRLAMGLVLFWVLAYTTTIVSVHLASARSDACTEACVLQCSAKGDAVR